MDEAAIRRDWAQRGFSCEVWSDPPGRAWENFVHDVDELLMLVAGELEVALPDRTWRPRPGEEVWIPAGVRHSVRNVGSTPNRWLYGYRRR
ncbi:MAG: hypothetical protein KatS3mg131_3100 [Candidatus Tectimicrobiota bacterium]|nr:MAG: hypothetical protein KatS3mg131_3100 [Candidatus Tectomicrobia bacterium]